MQDFFNCKSNEEEERNKVVAVAFALYTSVHDKVKENSTLKSVSYVINFDILRKIIETINNLLEY